MHACMCIQCVCVHVYMCVSVCVCAYNYVYVSVCCVRMCVTIRYCNYAEFLKEQVTVSLTNCLSHQLQSTLLLARQCSSEGSHLFPSYYNWLQVNA